MTIETGNRLLPGIEHRPTELGRIRLGDKSPKGLPTKIETWRLTSANKAALEAAAAIYGGTVEAWTDAPDEGYFELLTESTALHRTMLYKLLLYLYGHIDRNRKTNSYVAATWRHNRRVNSHQFTTQIYECAA